MTYHEQRQAKALPRWRYVMELRRAGRKWREIAEELGIDASMAHRLGKKAEAYRNASL